MLNKDQISKIQRDQFAQLQADASLYHQIFAQTENGQKLLQKWMELYVMGGFTPDTATVTELAKAEARREFVCMIIQKLNLAESPNE